MVKLLFHPLVLFIFFGIIAFFLTINLQTNGMFTKVTSPECSYSQNFISTPYLADPTVFDSQDEELIVYLVGDP